MSASPTKQQRRNTDCQMLIRLVAVSLQKRLDTGATRPIIVRCRDGNGNLVEDDFVVKLGSDLQGEAFLELFCSLLATRLGLKAPQPAVVRISEEFVSSVVASGANELGQRLGRNVGSNFSCKFLPKSQAWIAGRRPITHKLLHQAGEILAFDALIDNADRRTENRTCWSMRASYL